MLLLASIFVLVAILLALWSVVRIVRRDDVRLHTVGCIILFVAAAVVAWMYRPHYRISSTVQAANDPHGYVVDVVAPKAEDRHLEQDAAAIVRHVCKAHPEVDSVEVRFYSPGQAAGGYRAAALWTPGTAGADGRVMFRYVLSN